MAAFATERNARSMICQMLLGWVQGCDICVSEPPRLGSNIPQDSSGHMIESPQNSHGCYCKHAHAAHAGEVVISRCFQFVLTISGALDKAAAWEGCGKKLVALSGVWDAVTVREFFSWQGHLVFFFEFRVKASEFGVGQGL